MQISPVKTLGGVAKPVMSVDGEKKYDYF